MSPAAAPEIATWPTLPLTLLREFPNNPRQHWGDLSDLIASVRDKGVLEPLTVRPVGGSFEILSGARRFRAAQHLGLKDLPVMVRELDDESALELAVVTNLQREDVHPLDEARAYAQLQDHGATAGMLSAKVGKHISYVYKRLKLLELVPAAMEAFEKDEITVAHAERLARLPAEKQEAALDECFLPLFRGDEDAREAAPLSKLDRWIETHVKVDLKAEDTPHYFPQLLEEVEAAPLQDTSTSNLIELSESHRPVKDLGGERKGAPLGRQRWHPIATKKDQCEHVQRGVIVHGGPMRVLEVCATKGCAKHFPAPVEKPAGAAQGESRESAAAVQQKEEDQRAARTRAADRGNLLLRSLVLAVATRTKTVDLGLVAEAFYQRNEHRLGESIEKALKDLGIKTFAKQSAVKQAQMVNLLAMADSMPHFYGYDAKVSMPANLIAAAKSLKVDIKALEAEARTAVPEPGDETLPAASATKKAAPKAEPKSAAKKRAKKR